MKPKSEKVKEKQWYVIQRTCILLMGLLSFSACSIWDSNLHPDYQSTRADQLCHPYGNCSQGEWIADAGVVMDSREATKQCDDMIRARYGNGWWEDSVARGLELQRCMEKKGFRLEQ